MEPSGYSTKLNHLDLAKKKFGLEKIFDSVINKIPDLCMPASHRLAGEKDYFNETAKLKLVPFRKQEVFDRCISPAHGTPTEHHDQVEDSSWPFANPIPSCMLIEDNIDNLRTIIVSSLEIEWKMLTPVRPETEYEENYFDKLVFLHRSRYKFRLESGYLKANKNGSVFRHTRHGISLQHDIRHDHHYHHPSVSLGVKLKSKFRARAERSRSIVQPLAPARLTIPTLTLTYDERAPSEPIVHKLDNDDKDAEGSSNNSDYDDFIEFSYENFSRFSRRNSRQNPAMKERIQMKSSNDELQFHGQYQIGLGQGDKLLEDQVEDIMSQLMSTSMTDKG